MREEWPTDYDLGNEYLSTIENGWFESNPGYRMLSTLSSMVITCDMHVLAYLSQSIDAILSDEKHHVFWKLCDWSSRKIFIQLYARTSVPSEREIEIRTDKHLYAYITYVLLCKLSLSTEAHRPDEVTDDPSCKQYSAFFTSHVVFNNQLIDENGTC